MAGFNGRIDTIQAAIILVNIRHFSKRVQKRRNIAQRYLNEIRNKCIEHPSNICIENDTFFTYQITCMERDRLQSYLAECGITSKVQHYPLMCDTKPFIKYEKEAQNAQSVISKTLCLPCFEALSEDEISHVVDKINHFK